ncbi:Gfo/Idh/MocA family oxidoreductase [bacterium]|jgi:predicted dehydrogenase|nr:Gfo/Idh/MocA family oxidoreductase [bacterium]
MLKCILFIGLGGAGQRHLRLFRENLSGNDIELIAYRTTNKTPLLNPDFSVNQKDSIEDFYKVNIYNDLEDVLALKPDLVVISTPSSLHLEYAQLCAEQGLNIFVEKPISNSIKGLLTLRDTVKKNNVAIQVGFQRRFHPHLSKINEIIKSKKIGQILTVNFTVASYIPRWHPYENYLNLYACRKDLGGGVLLTEIHEIDLTVWYFGAPESVVCVGGTYSDVGMDVEDTVSLTLDYIKFLVQINLTFWQKHHERSFSISGEGGYLSWNQDDNLLVEEYFDDTDGNEQHSNPSLGNDDMFDLQIKSIIQDMNSKNSDTNMNDSIVSMKIIEAAKESMSKGRVIKLDKDGS